MGLRFGAGASTRFQVMSDVMRSSINELRVGGASTGGRVVVESGSLWLMPQTFQRQGAFTSGSANPLTLPFLDGADANRSLVFEINVS